MNVLSDIIVRVIFVAAFCTGSFILPDKAYRYICFKCDRRNREYPERSQEMVFKISACVFCVLFTSYCFYALSIWKATFAGIFFLFAEFGIMVDMRMRIIGNEMLLAMLPFAFAYRIADGGLDSLIGSLIAVIFVVLFYSAAAGITYLHKGLGGVGMGDVKLSMVAAIAVGFPGVIYFVFGIAIAIIGYLSFKIIRMPVFIFKLFDTESTFPMCGHIMFGLLITVSMQNVLAVYLGDMGAIWITGI